MTIRPSKWILYAPVAILPLLAALFVNGGAVHDDLSRRAGAALKAAGADWASVSVEGRDARVSGDAPSDAAVETGVRAVAGTHGIRRTETATRVVPPPPPPAPPEMKPPTVDSLESNSARPVITGTWPSAVAKTLTVRIGPTAYTLGQGGELTATAC